MLLSSCRLVSRSSAGLVFAASKSKFQQQPLQTSKKLLSRRVFSSSSSSETKKTGWWHSAQIWGGLGAIAGWGMSGAAIFDAMNNGPEVISLTMTPVLIVYSSLFARWAWVVQPRNLLLCGCHVTNVMAQLNQMKRALEYKMEIGQEAEVKKMMETAAMGGAVIAGSVVAGPAIRSALTSRELGFVSSIAASPAGPFTGTVACQDTILYSAER